ncbi:MAG: hypothetical protein AWU57_3545 [Marinobacter sp. T13-3]|nr:MAG: hypothetical protein AWU57_3545 [Marinobacter sp. T13-3]
MFENTVIRMGIRLLTLWLFTVTGFAVANPMAEPPAPFPQSTLESTTRIESSGHLVLFSPVREIRTFRSHGPPAGDRGGAAL